MKKIIIALFAALLIIPAIAKTPLVVLPENAALLTTVPDDYPTEEEAFRDCSGYEILIDPATQDLHPEPYFCPDFPRLSPVYVHHYRKLPKAPIHARDKGKSQRDRVIFEKMFSAYLSSGNSIQNKRWILTHWPDVVELQANGCQWDDPLMFYSFNALFNPELFSQLHACNESGTLRCNHIPAPSPMLALVGETDGKKIIFDWKLLTPFYFFPEELRIVGDYAQVRDGRLGYVCDCVFPSLYIENPGDIKHAKSDIWLWRLGIDSKFLYDRGIGIKKAILLLKGSPEEKPSLD